MLKKEFVSTNVAYRSCIGTIASFPRGCGNYIGIHHHNNEALPILNLSLEDLEDMISNKTLDDTMNAIVYCKDGKDRFAYIIDERIPKKCLTPFWVYGCKNKHITDFIKLYHNIPEDSCSCKNENSYEWVVSRTLHSKTKTIDKCKSCGTEYTKYTLGWHDPTTKPVYFEGKKRFIVKLLDDSISDYVGEFKHHDYRRHNEDAFSFPSTVIAWKYFEQPDSKEF